VTEPEPELHSADVPQEDNLGDVRRSVQAIADGHHDTASIAQRTQRSARHAGYAINAAIALEWIGEPDESKPEEEGLVIHELGKKLLATKAGSADERKIWRESIEKSYAVAAIAPQLLGAAEPEVKTIAASIVKLAALAQSTAERRARTLIAWRRQALEPGAA
jgi:hypothetical protein